MHAHSPARVHFCPANLTVGSAVSNTLSVAGTLISKETFNNTPIDKVENSNKWVLSACKSPLFDGKNNYNSLFFFFKSPCNLSSEPGLQHEHSRTSGEMGNVHPWVSRGQGTAPREHTAGIVVTAAGAFSG